MKIILETDRLILREMVDEDFISLKKILTDKETMKYYKYSFLDKHVFGWLNWCKDSYQKHGFGLWAIIYKESGEMIGDCGISLQYIDNEWKHEIGYHLRSDYHRLGIGKEMAGAIRDYFFTHFDYDEVYSYMDEDNIASYKTAESIGLKYLHIFTDTSGSRCRVYRLSREEWKNKYGK